MKTTTQNATNRTTPARTSRAAKLAGIALAAMIGTAGAPIASAGLADDIKAKVNNINTLTGRVNTRTSNLVDKANEQVQRLDEVGSTVNAVIAETDIIKRSLDPLNRVQAVRDRFAQIDFDPMDLLEGEEFEYALAQFKQRRQEAQDRLNDPDLEVFRGEFQGLLANLRSVLNPDVESPQVSPLEKVVASAPRVVIALLKKATEGVLSPLVSSVTGLAEAQAELKALGVVHDFTKEHGVDADFVRCNVYALNAERIYRKALSATKRVQMVKHLLSFIDVIVPKDEDDIAVAAWGWVGVEVDPSKPVEFGVKMLQIRAEILEDRYDLDREVAEHYATARGCNESAFGQQN